MAPRLRFPALVALYVALGLGVIAATLSAAIAVKWMVGYLQRHGMGVFGWYRIGIGITVFLLLATGALRAA